ncbi:MAG: hypothetical protein COY80_01625 [Candidatus Pacebacteria bacterium CG_4_10_14_0_8_um_filter_42_14]|nr:MAG: hypothetical protein COY80_01625 [Candidatus Pacebacteria bacterium CG_4_10_14_0_8_um_filter_42_14]
MKIAVLGSTQYSTKCAETLIQDKSIKIEWIVTPIAKPIGKNKILTCSPLEPFANKNNIQLVNVTGKIDADLKNQIESLPQPDYLLVVDFGYFIPEWLLDLPKIKPLNIHPSALPKWRGSSPGQFALLFGEKTSAVTIIEMTNTFDAGPIFAQHAFSVAPDWNYRQYYDFAYDLVCANLVADIVKHSTGQAMTVTQPEISPTLTAHKLTRDDGFIPWELVVAAQNNTQSEEVNLTDVLTKALEHHRLPATMIEHAIRAFSPWPQVWTLVNTAKGEKRMKLLSATIENEKLVLGSVQIEGKKAARWSEVKNGLSNS